MRLLIRIGLMMAAVWLTVQIVPGLEFTGDFWALLLVALLLGVANGIVIPILKLFALPVRILTLGLATLVINVAVIIGLIALAENLDLGISSDGLLASTLGALALTVLSSIISFLTND